MRLNLVQADGQKRFSCGDGFAQVPNFNWNRNNRKANFNSWQSDNVNANFAAPSLRDCSIKTSTSIQRVGVVVGSLVKRDGKYLLVKENPNGKDVYNLPAGHVDKGEQLEIAAVRETKEETGYDVQLIEQFALYHESAPQSVKHVYLAEIIGGEEHAQEGEILEVVWQTFDEIAEHEKAGRMRAPWVFDVIGKLENRS